MQHKLPDEEKVSECHVRHANGEMEFVRTMLQC